MHIWKLIQCSYLLEYIASVVLVKLVDATKWALIFDSELSTENLSKHLLVPYVRIDVYKYYSSHTQLFYGMNYKKQSKKLNHWIFLSLEYNCILIIN